MKQISSCSDSWKLQNFPSSSSSLSTQSWQLEQPNTFSEEPSLWDFFFLDLKTKTNSLQSIKLSRTIMTCIHLLLLYKHEIYIVMLTLGRTLGPLFFFSSEGLLVFLLDLPLFEFVPYRIRLSKYMKKLQAFSKRLTINMWL